MYESEIVLRGWLIERGIFIITISAFLLGVKVHRLPIERRIHLACLYFDLALFTSRTMTSFSIGTNRTIGTNEPSELPCTQPDHMGNLSPLNEMHIHQ